MANTMSKSELIQRIMDGHPNEIARKDVKGVIEAVAELCRRLGDEVDQAAW
jgi:nucleoid DNA-binding protein